MSDEDEMGDDGPDEVGAMQGAPTGSGVSPTWTWGSSATVLGDTTSGFGVVRTSAQLAQVSLPEPAVCTFYLQATFRATDILNDSVLALTVNLNTGLGRVTVPRQMTFALQPAINSPLEITIPFIPLHTLNVDVEVAFVKNSVDPTFMLAVDIYFEIAPITRIPQSIQKLQFGMALPGEADDLDDELQEDLEAEGPTAAAAVAEGRRRVDGSNDQAEEEQPDDDQADDEPAPQVPPWLLQLVDQLTQRYGRQPTKPELRAAVERMKVRRKRLRAREGRTRG